MEDRISRIKEAALSVFQEKGYYETKITDIAIKSGLSVGTIYKYFPGKKVIFDSLDRLDLLDIRPNYNIERHKIILKSSEYFAEHGYRETSMDKIASLCGFSKATLYKYFPNKEELFNAIVNETSVNINFKSILSDSNNAVEEVLSAFASNFIQMMTEQHRISLIKMGIKEAKRFPPSANSTLNRHIGYAHHEIAAYLNKLNEEGRIACKDTDFAAKYFINTLFSYVFMEKIIPFSRYNSSPDDFIAHHIHIFLSGLRI